MVVWSPVATYFNQWTFDLSNVQKVFTIKWEYIPNIKYSQEKNTSSFDTSSAAWFEMSAREINLMPIFLNILLSAFFTREIGVRENLPYWTRRLDQHNQFFCDVDKFFKQLPGDIQYTFVFGLIS